VKGNNRVTERRVLRQPDQKVRVLGRAEGEMDKQLISTSRFSDEVKVQNSLMTDELFQSVNMDVNEDFKGR